MVEENRANENTENTNNGQNDAALRDLRGVFIAATWALIFLALVARCWPNLPQRMAFFTGNLFNLIIAFAVIAQVIIYRKQWQVMRLQWQEANRQAKSSAQLIELMVLIECAYIRTANLIIQQAAKQRSSDRWGIRKCGAHSCFEF
jgi:hypothetical protein